MNLLKRVRDKRSAYAYFLVFAFIAIFIVAVVPSRVLADSGAANMYNDKKKECLDHGYYYATMSPTPSKDDIQGFCIESPNSISGSYTIINPSGSSSSNSESDSGPSASEKKAQADKLCAAQYGDNETAYETTFNAGLGGPSETANIKFTLQGACVSGYQLQGGSTTCESYFGKYFSSDPKTLKPLTDACIFGRTEVSPQVDQWAEEEAGKEEDENSCQVDGIGWIVCPVMTFLGGIADGAYSIVEGMLSVDSTLITNTSLKNAHKAFLDIANAGFIIVFIIVIYAQLTGAGSTSVGSAYQLKKIAPRLIIAAILVNLSYYISAIAVDLSNIVGSSVGDLISSIPSGSTSTSTTNGLEYAGQAITWGGILVGVLAAAAMAVLAITSSVLIAAVLALAMILLILLGRQAAIVILIVLSPLAFLAWVLPNTESLFKKWWKMLGSMLMLYPIVAVVFAGSQLAANIVANAGAESDWSMQAMAMGIATIPFFVVPSLLKGALNGLGSVGTKLSGFSGKMNARVGKESMETSRLGEAKRAHNLRSTQGRAFKRRNSRVSTWLASDEANNGVLGGRFKGAGNRVASFIGDTPGAAAAVAATDEATMKAVAQRKILMMEKHGPAGVLAQDSAGVLQDVGLMRQNGAISGASLDLQNSLETNDDEGTRAATQILLGKGNPGREQLKAVLAHHQNNNPDFAESAAYQGVQHEINSANLKASDNVLAMSASTTSSVANLEANPSTYTGLDDSEHAGQSTNSLKTADLLDQKDPKRNNVDFKPRVGADRAQRILDKDKEGTIKLTDDKRNLYMDIATRPKTP